MMKRRKWTPEEDAYLIANFSDRPTHELLTKLTRTLAAVRFRAGKLGLNKSKEFLRTLALHPAFIEASKSTQFDKGMTPWNKGMHVGFSERTQFKEGHLPWCTAQVGTIVKENEGYLYIKLEMPSTWKLLHRHIWESSGRTIPENHVLVFKDGNRKNCALDNLELIDKREHMMRNHLAEWKDYPKELKEAIHLKNQLKRTIRERAKSEK